MNDGESLELESSGGFVAPKDDRARTPEPPPVKVVAVTDVVLPAPAGLERRMDEFYVGLLGFVEKGSSPGQRVYQAENVRVRFQQFEGPLVRSGYPVLQVQIPLLADVEERLIRARLEYTRQRGLVPGSESLVLRDPSGNWVEISEIRPLI